MSDLDRCVNFVELFEQVCKKDEVNYKFGESGHAELAQLRADLATVTAERDKFADMFNTECLKVTQLRAQLATYERMKAVRQ